MEAEFLSPSGNIFNSTLDKFLIFFSTQLISLIVRIFCILIYSISCTFQVNLKFLPSLKHYTKSHMNFNGRILLG